jgi:hypothetical protein
MKRSCNGERSKSGRDKAFQDLEKGEGGEIGKEWGVGRGVIGKEGERDGAGEWIGFGKKGERGGWGRSKRWGFTTERDGGMVGKSGGFERGAFRRSKRWAVVIKNRTTGLTFDRDFNGQGGAIIARQTCIRLSQLHSGRSRACDCPLLCRWCQ